MTANCVIRSVQLLPESTDDVLFVSLSSGYSKAMRYLYDDKRGGCEAGFEDILQQAARMKRCPECSRFNPKDARFCCDCGKPISPASKAFMEKMEKIKEQHKEQHERELHEEGTA